jgi:hypothetical protein
MPIIPSLSLVEIPKLFKNYSTPAQNDIVLGWTKLYIFKIKKLKGKLLFTPLKYPPFLLLPPKFKM